MVCQVIQRTYRIKEEVIKDIRPMVTDQIIGCSRRRCISCVALPLTMDSLLRQMVELASAPNGDAWMRLFLSSLPPIPSQQPIIPSLYSSTPFLHHPASPSLSPFTLPAPYPVVNPVPLSLSSSSLPPVPAPPSVRLLNAPSTSSSASHSSAPLSLVIPSAFLLNTEIVSYAGACAVASDFQPKTQRQVTGLNPGDL